MNNKAAEITQNHIDRVAFLLDSLCSILHERGQVHDASKFSPEEMGPLAEMQKLVDEQGQAPYGSEEYNRRLEILKPMLEHHYQRNSHHPEHYPNGIAGMDLFDIIEMFCDWKAASERGQESHMNISHSIKRYNIEPQLASILINTAKSLEYSYK